MVVEITREDCEKVGGEWERGRCIAPRRLRFTVSYELPDGRIETLRGIPYHLKDRVVRMISDNPDWREIRVDGLPYHKHFEIFGGIVDAELLKREQEQYERAVAGGYARND